MMYTLCVLAAIALGAVFLLTFPIRMTTAQLIEAMDPQLNLNLLPFAVVDDERLWRVVGGMRGLWRLYIASGAIVTFAVRFAMHYPESHRQATEIFVAALYLRAMPDSLRG